MLCKASCSALASWSARRLTARHAICMASGDAAAESYNFGKFRVDKSEVFATSQHSFAFVNLKPIVPGHVLVAPTRTAARFADLDAAECTDLWLLAQRVGKGIENHHRADALTLTIQDGPAAGQTVPHLHIHVLPRRFGDFDPNDKIYDAVDASSKEDAQQRAGEPLNLDGERVERTPEQMAEEAAQLRQLF